MRSLTDHRAWGAAAMAQEISLPEKFIAYN